MEKKKHIIVWVVVGIIVIGLGALIAVSYIFANRCYDKYQVLNKVERKDSDNVTYTYFNGNILKCSRAGISAISNEGKSLWNGGYEMKQPQMDTCGKYVVVASVGGKELYVYSGEDEGQCIETNYAIVRAKVNKKGIVAVMLEDTDSNVLNVYNPYNSAQQLLVEIPTNVAEDGYPLDFDISPDGNSVVIAYMTVEGNVVSNKVNFYNFTEVGQDQNTLVGGKQYEKKMISSIDFVGEDEVAVFYENGYDIFANMKQPKEKTSKTFDDAIYSIAYNDKYIAVVLGETDAEKKKLQLFDRKGKQKMSQEISFSYASVNLYQDDLFFVSAKECHVIRSNGREKFSCEFQDAVDYLFPTNSANVYTLVDQGTIQKIELSAR